MEAASDIKNTFLHVSQKVFILFEQAVKGHIDIVEYLLQQGAKMNWDINLFFKRRSTPVFVSCDQGRPDVLKLLLRFGGDWMALGDINGMTPLQIADSHTSKRSSWRDKHDDKKSPRDPRDLERGRKLCLHVLQVRE
jgi:hypothetical protein